MNRFKKSFNHRVNMHDNSGSIAIETGFMLPLLLFCAMGSLELSMAYMTQNNVQGMAISYAQIIAKKSGAITEKDINSLILNSNRNSGEANFLDNGRVFITAALARAPTQKPLKLWQRCSSQPAGKAFKSGFSAAEITLPTGADPMVEGYTYVIVEVKYDSQPLTGFFLTERSPTGKRIKYLSDFKSEMARDNKTPLVATLADPDGGSSKASTVCT
jgi:hypothetical protein